MAKLVIRSGRNVGTEFKLVGDKLVVGRRTANPIPIADPKASREHSMVHCKGDAYFVQDLSRNGTFVNDKPADKNEPGTPIKFGDTVKIGDTVMELVDEKTEPLNIEIPGYTIHEKIGMGGMGVVFKAKQISMDRIVAIKVLNERYSTNNEFVDRFIREARAAGKLNHPNVVHVHDISRANGRHYFSMEFIDGSSVKDVLRAEKKLDVTKALDIVLQTAKALEFAHENQIVHRDIKPDNIMVTKEGIVKIADLGIAKTFEETAPSAKEHRRVMGTPHYMAPEQALGKAIDHRVDIYSLGATFYHMVTGTTPFSGNTAHEILKAHVQSSLPAVQDLNPKIPDSVCFIIERMMAKLPEKRYASMSKLIEDVQRVQEDISTGIERLDAGESTIMRAAGKATAISGRAEEIATGQQTAISKIGLAAALIAAFCLAGAVAIIVVRRAGESSESKTPENDEPETKDNRKPSNAESRSHPQAKKLLEAALTAEAASDPSTYEENLKQIMSKYAASEEAEEARRRLKSMAETREKTEKQRVETLLANAEKFEAENRADLSGSIQKYQAVAAAAQAHPAILEKATASVERLNKRLEEENARTVAAAYKDATERAATQKARFDFDSARSALEEFLNAHKKADKEREQIQAQLDAINKDADAYFERAKSAAEKVESPAAIAEWNRYINQVKDSKNLPAAKQALQEQEAKAETFATESMTKSNEKALKYEYVEAITLLRAVQRKLPGMKFEELAKTREDSLKRQKDVFEKVMQTAKEKVPLVAPFYTDAKYPNLKWKLAAVNGDRVSFDSDPPNAGPGFTRRLADMTPKEQYDFHRFFLPKELSAEQHKAMAAFCVDRGLTTEAEQHDQK